MIKFMDVISIVGFSSMVLGFIYVGRKLQVLDDLRDTVNKIKCNLKVVADFLTKKFTDFNAAEITQ